MTRLNKYLAAALGVSRREADDIITKRLVTINGTTAAIGQQVHPGDDVKVEEKTVTPPRKATYIALNKPVGYVCSRKQQGDIPTIYSLLPQKFAALKSVGRLDKDSSGILLLTDDGDFSHTMTHPKFYKTKEYIVKLNKDLEPLHQQMINDFGIQLDDGASKLTLEKLKEGNLREWHIIMSEGRNRQIRRTFLSLGYTVTQLHRTQFGPYNLASLDIKRGHYKEIDPIS